MLGERNGDRAYGTVLGAILRANIEMAWEKPSETLIEHFGRWLPDDSNVERRKMFGCPCAFVNGNMFAGVHEQNLIVRLSEG